MVQVFVIYFLDFQNNENNRIAKPCQLPIQGIIKLVFLLVPPEGLEPSSSVQKACRPTNSATDLLGNPPFIIDLFPS
jgi:hypothetical protein